MSNEKLDALRRVLGEIALDVFAAGRRWLSDNWHQVKPIFIALLVLLGVAKCAVELKEQSEACTPGNYEFWDLQIKWARGFVAEGGILDKRDYGRLQHYQGLLAKCGQDQL